MNHFVKAAVLEKKDFPSKDLTKKEDLKTWPTKKCSLFHEILNQKKERK